MRYKMVASLALFAGFAMAQDLYRDIHNDRRDLRHDYARVDRMRNDIARDRVRLNEDIRCGRSWAAAEDARDLARDQRALDAQLRDIRHDRRDLSHDYYYDNRY